MSDAPGNPVIELKSVTAASAGFEILKNVSVSFSEGAVTIVLGSAGSGKSTLLKTAAGLIVPESGEVMFRGTSLSAFSEDDDRFFRSRTAFAFQDAALWANQTIFSNIALPLRVHKSWMSETDISERVREVLSLVGYTEGLALRPADLSSGEQKLISLARSLVLDPELVFLDNPATGLDEDAKELVYDLLDSLRKAGKSLLLVTGDMGLVHRIADHVVIIREGRIAAAGTYNDIVACEVPEAAGLVARLRARGARTPTPQTVILPPKTCPEPGEQAAGASNEEMDL